MKIKQRAKMIVETSYVLAYRRTEFVGFGFRFPCDEDGNVLLDKMQPEGRENYRKCREGEFKVECQGVQSETTRYRQPGIGICDDCGEEVTLQGFTCTCRKCGADYNSAGQRLAPRSQWGTEFDPPEPLGEILGVDSGVLDGGDPF